MQPESPWGEALLPAGIAVFNDFYSSNQAGYLASGYVPVHFAFNRADNAVQCWDEIRIGVVFPHPEVYRTRFSAVFSPESRGGDKFTATDAEQTQFP